MKNQSLLLALFLAFPFSSWAQPQEKKQTERQVHPGIVTANALLKEGKIDAAREQLRKLADAPGGGLPIANFSLAKDAIRVGTQHRSATLSLAWNKWQQSPGSGAVAPDYESLRKTTVAKLAEARMRLEKAIAKKPEFPAAYAMLASIHVQENRVDHAVALLEGASEFSPGLGMQLARIHRRQMDEEKAIAAATLARDYFSQKAEVADSKAEVWKALVSAEAFLKREEEAEKIVRNAIFRFSSDPNARKVFEGILARTFLRRAHLSLLQKPADPEAALTLLEEAITLTSANVRVLAMLSRIGAKHPERKDRVIQLEQKIEKSPGVFSALGDAAAMREDYTSAAGYYEKVLGSKEKLNPSLLAMIQNNLAYCLSKLDPPQCDRALELVQKALKAPKLAPKSRLSYVGTRAEIHLAAENWTSAVTDFRKILPMTGAKRRVEILRMMGTALEKSGQSGLAKGQFEEADRIEQALGNPTSKSEKQGLDK